MANRDTWTVTAVGRRGGLLVTADDGRPVTVPAPGVTPAGAAVRVLPADYVTDQVELAYASTVHGVQGDTVTAAHLVIGDHTAEDRTRAAASHLMAASLAARADSVRTNST